MSNYIEQPERGQQQDISLNTDPTVIEAKVMKDYAHYLGKDVLVNRICGFVGDDSTDIELSPPAKVRVEATSEQSLKRWIDGWCDPLYEVALVENHPQLNGVRSLWVHGPSLHLNGKQTEASDIVAIAEQQSGNLHGNVQRNQAIPNGVVIRSHSADRDEPFGAFWSNDYGWTSLDEATVFTQDEMPTLSLPSEEDAEWMLQSVAASEVQAELLRSRGGATLSQGTLLAEQGNVSNYTHGQNPECLEQAMTADYIELEVILRSKTTFGTDKETIRVWDGQSAKDVAERSAQGYGAEVVEIRNLDGSIYEEAVNVEGYPRPGM